MRAITLTDAQAGRLLAGEQVEVRKRMPRMETWMRDQIASGHRRIKHLFDNVWGAGCGPDGAFVCRIEDAVCCPFGEVGAVMWCREAWASCLDHSPDGCGLDGALALYRATPRAQPARWRPATSMPRWACRMYARCIEVRVDTSGERPEWVGVFGKCEASE